MKFQSAHIFYVSGSQLGVPGPQGVRDCRVGVPREVLDDHKNNKNINKQINNDKPTTTTTTATTTTTTIVQYHYYYQYYQGYNFVTLAYRDSVFSFILASVYALLLRFHQGSCL